LPNAQATLHSTSNPERSFKEFQPPFKRRQMNNLKDLSSTFQKGQGLQSMCQVSNGLYSSQNQTDYADAIFSQDALGVLSQEKIFEFETPSAIHDLPQESLSSGFLSKRRLDFQSSSSGVTPKYCARINTSKN